MANKDPVIIERTKENNWKLTAAQLDETLVKVRTVCNCISMNNEKKFYPRWDSNPQPLD